MLDHEYQVEYEFIPTVADQYIKLLFSLTIQYCSLNLISTSVLQYFPTDHPTRMIQTSLSSNYSVYSEIIPIFVLFKVTYCPTFCSGFGILVQQ